MSDKRAEEGSRMGAKCKARVEGEAMVQSTIVKLDKKV
jgi:hypothetical protein